MLNRAVSCFLRKAQQEGTNHCSDGLVLVLLIAGILDTAMKFIVTTFLPNLTHTHTHFETVGDYYVRLDSAMKLVTVLA